MLLAAVLHSMAIARSLHANKNTDWIPDARCSCSCARIGRAPYMVMRSFPASLEPKPKRKWFRMLASAANAKLKRSQSDDKGIASPRAGNSKAQCVLFCLFAMPFVQSVCDAFCLCAALFSIIVVRNTWWRLCLEWVSCFRFLIKAGRPRHHSQEKQRR